MRLIRTDSNNRDFKALVKLLDKNLAISDGDEHDFYHQFNNIDVIKHTIVMYHDESPIAIGALKQYDKTTMEIKRMFTISGYRGQGIATKILVALEDWAAELGMKRCILETGKKQPKAIALYNKTGYSIISNYDQYAGIENSVCFEKLLTPPFSQK